MRILLVDDHVLVVEGMRYFLSANHIEVVGTATHSAEALQQFQQLHPDLVLMDSYSEENDGFELTKMIKSAYPEAKIVMLSAGQDDEKLLVALQAGVCGYLSNQMKPEIFIHQLNRIYKGELLFPTHFIEGIVKEFCRYKQNPMGEVYHEEQLLTSKQTKILQSLAKGLTYKEIASQLGITVSTVRYHIKEILSKTKLKNRAQLIAHALKLGFGDERKRRQ